MSVWYWGFLGGILPDVLRVLSARHESAPPYLTSWFFWASVIGLSLLGGFVANISDPHEVTSALALGFGAPELLSKLAGQQQIPSGPAKVSDSNLGQFKIQQSTPTSGLAPASGLKTRVGQLRNWWAN